MTSRPGPVVLRGATVAGLLAAIVGAATSARQPVTVVAPPDRGAMRPAVPERERATADLARVPLAFEANRGQTAPEVRYLARAGDYTVHLTPSHAIISPRGAATGDVALRMSFAGGAGEPRIEALDDQPTKVHYYKGNDPATWLRDVPTYGRVAYREVYPGVDVVFYGNPRSLEFDFIVAPGADARNIELVFDGADRMAIDSKGNLRLHNAAGQIVLGRPGIYQAVGGTRRPVEGDYVLQSSSRVGFRLAAYDESQPLVIDPHVEVYLTYLGGGGDENNNSGEGALAVDAQGHAFVSGGTNSASFPVPHVVTFEDVFVVKLNPAGAGPAVWSAVLGGSASDAATASAVGPDGDLYVAGKTTSGDFPPLNGLSHPSGGAFLAKLDGDTGALLYTSVLGGGSQDEAYGVAVDPDGNAYVVGTTNAAGLPPRSPDVAGPYKTVPISRDYFVAKFDPDLVGDPSFVYLTFLGGDGFDETRSPVIDVDALGFAYVTGRIGDTAGFQTVNGLSDTGPGAFVVKLNQAASQLVYATYLSGTNEGTGIAVDAGGNAYVTGHEAGGFVVADELTANSCTTSDRFVVKLSFDEATSTLSRPFASCIATSSWDVAVDGAARIHFGQALIDLTKLGADRLVYSNVGPGGLDVGVDAFCSAFIGGRTQAGVGVAHGPLGPFQAVGGGNWDAYAAKVGGSGPLAYISLFDKDTVAVIETATGTPYDLDPVTVGVQSEITVGDGPFGVATDPVAPRVWVTNQLGNSVSAINTTTHVPITIAGFSSPAGVAVSPDGAWVFVANQGNHTVAIIDAATKTLYTTVALPAGSSPLGVAVRDVNGTLSAFVTNQGTGSLSIVTLVSGVASVATYALGMSGPAGIAVTSGLAPKIYVANGFSTTVSVIDGLSLALLDTVIVGDIPFGVAISPDDTRAYVTNAYPLGAAGGNSVSVIDTATDDIVPLPTLFNQIEVGGWPQGIAVHPDGTRVYVANSFQIPCSGCPPQLPGTEDPGTPPGDDVGHTLSVINATTHTTVVSLPLHTPTAPFPEPIAFGTFIAPLSAAFDPGCVPGQALMQVVSLSADVAEAPLPRGISSWLANEVTGMAKAILARRFATADHKVDRFVTQVRKQERRGKIPKRLAQSFVESAELVSKNLPQGLGDIPRHRLHPRPPAPVGAARVHESTSLGPG